MPFRIALSGLNAAQADLAAKGFYPQEKLDQTRVDLLGAKQAVGADLQGACHVARVLGGKRQRIDFAARRIVGEP